MDKTHTYVQKDYCVFLTRLNLFSLPIQTLYLYNWDVTQHPTLRRTITESKINQYSKYEDVNIFLA
jgi:hypothetical protein